MIEILTIISQLFFIIFLGYIAVKAKVLNQTTISGIGQFVLYVTLPSLIIINIANSDILAVLEPWFFIAYGGGSLLTYILTFSLFRFVFKNDTVGSGIKGIGSSFSNSAFIAFPLLSQFFDTPPITAFAMILIFENVIMMPLVLFVLEYGKRDKDKSTLQTITHVFAGLVKNPIILAVFVSIFLSVANITIPQFASDSLEILGNASAGAALFFIGGSLVSHSVSGNYRDITLVSLFKLILHPTMVALMILILPQFDMQMQTAAILFATVSMMGIYPIIGSRFGFASFCSSAILISTIISFFTITIFMMIL